MVSKRRGPRRKIEQEEAHAVVVVEGSRPGKPDVVDMVLPKNQSLMVMLMVTYATRALQERPTEVAAAFGLPELTNGYICLAMPEPEQTDGLAALLQGATMVACWLPEFWHFESSEVDPRGHVGQQVCDFMNSDEVFLEEMLQLVRLREPSPSGKPWIRRCVYAEQTYPGLHSTATRGGIAMEVCVFMDQDKFPRWAILALLEPEHDIRPVKKPSTGESPNFEANFVDMTALSFQDLEGLEGNESLFNF